MTKIPRTLHPSLNAPGLAAAAGAIYAGVSMAYNAYNHRGAWSTPVFIALVAAVAALLTRQVVTPVADPKDGNGNPLVAGAPQPVITVTATGPADVGPAIDAALKRYAQKGGYSAGARTVPDLPPPPASVTSPSAGTSGVIIEDAPAPEAP